MKVKKSKSLNQQEQLKALVQQKKALEEESRAKSEFIINIIHDIRSPLTGIAGLAHHLAEKTIKPEEKEYARVIQEGSAQLLDLLNTVINTKEAFKQDRKVVKKSFSLTQVLEKLRELEEPSVLEQNLKLEVDMDENLPSMLIGDQLKLERILLNLVSNAVKFTREGLIKIKIRLISQVKDQAHIEFSVSDNGIGIPIDQQEKVFKRYFKGNFSEKPKYSSHGLGLSIVQKYVKLLGGEISLKSKEGEGTTFSFVLPMRVSHEPSQKTLNVIASDNVLINGELLADAPRILLVEDNPIMLTSLKLMMDGIGIVPTTAVNSESAYKAVSASVFDLIITDIELPDESGYNLCKKIRALEKKQGNTPVKIIGLSGHSVEEISNRCKEAGMDDVYQKPLPIEVLKRIVLG